MTHIAPGLADPAHDSQRLFRAILEAFSHPGRIVTLPEAPTGVGPLSHAATAFVLTLVDRDTPLWLEPAFDVPAVRDFVRFHTGAPIATDEADASFALVTPERRPLLGGFAIGTDPYPDHSATLMIEVPSLTGGETRTVRGPGIATRAEISIAGLPVSLWNEWTANHALFPCGVDVVFTSGASLLALPRSSVVEA